MPSDAPALLHAGHLARDDGVELGSCEALDVPLAVDRAALVDVEGGAGSVCLIGHHASMRYANLHHKLIAVAKGDANAVVPLGTN